ncbi:permease [bacterium]|nr:permease [bacterium]
MDWKPEWKKGLWMLVVFLCAYFLPLDKTRFIQAIVESLALARWYAREHVIFCLVPAFFIAGVISVFVSQAAVIRYLGPKANKWIAYAVASVSGSVLAVCSCTILPLFSSIHKRGAGLGPACTFLYAGPAINILAMVLTARILGPGLGIARIAGAVVFSIVIGLSMHWIYRREQNGAAGGPVQIPDSGEARPLRQTALHLFILVAILVFANWGKPSGNTGFWHLVYTLKWRITGLFGIFLALSLVTVLKMRRMAVIAAVFPVIAAAFAFRDYPLIPFVAGIIGISVLLSRSGHEASEWMSSTWDFAKQILPLLGAGVLIAGLLLGSPGGGTGLIPGRWISSLVGGNTVFANFFASLAGAFMYFATLTEVPIVQGLLANGMGKGPALALLLAGPALSLPNMLVIRSVIGTRKTLVFISLVVFMATLSGWIYGIVFA